MMEKKSIKLLQITDTHCYAEDTARLRWMDTPIYPNIALAAVLKQLQLSAKDASALLVTGDLAQEEIPATYQRFSEIVRDLPWPVQALPGNHDQPAMMREHLASHVRLDTSVCWGNWQGLLLDTHRFESPAGHLEDYEYQRLKQQLEQVPDGVYVVIFMHHHPVPIGSEWMDKMALQQPERFWALLATYPQVKLVVNGHIHQAFSGVYRYDDGREVQVLGTPATCVQLRPVTQELEFDHTVPGWREIVLHADGRFETEVFYLDETPGL